MDGSDADPGVGKGLTPQRVRTPVRVPCTQRPNLGPNAPIGVPISGPKRVRWVRGVLCNFIAIHCRTPSRTSSLSSWLITTRVKVTVLTTLARLELRLLTLQCKLSISMLDLQHVKALRTRQALGMLGQMRRQDGSCCPV